MTPTFRVSHLAHVRACCGILLEDRFAYGGAWFDFGPVVAAIVGSQFETP